jgi:hypothetical protein
LSNVAAQVIRVGLAYALIAPSWADGLTTDEIGGRPLG